MKPTVIYNAIQSNLAHRCNIRISVFWHLTLCHWVFPNILPSSSGPSSARTSWTAWPKTWRQYDPSSSCEPNGPQYSSTFSKTGIHSFLLYQSMSMPWMISTKWPVIIYYKCYHKYIAFEHANQYSSSSRGTISHYVAMQLWVGSMFSWHHFK